MNWVRWYLEVSSFQAQRGWTLLKMSIDPFSHPLSPSDSVPTMPAALFYPILPVCSIQDHLHASLYPLLLLSDLDYALPRLISISGNLIILLEYLELIPSKFRVEYPRYKVLKEHGSTFLDLSLEHYHEQRQVHFKKLFPYEFFILVFY